MSRASVNCTGRFGSPGARTSPPSINALVRRTGHHEKRSVGSRGPTMIPTRVVTTGPEKCLFTAPSHLILAMLRSCKGSSPHCVLRLAQRCVLVHHRGSVRMVDAQPGKQSSDATYSMFFY